MFYLVLVLGVEKCAANKDDYLDGLREDSAVHNSGYINEDAALRMIWYLDLKTAQVEIYELRYRPDR